MKLRKIGDEIDIELAPLLRESGSKNLQASAAVAKTERLKDAKTKAQIKAVNELVTRSLAVALSSLEDKCKELEGAKLIVSHQGYAAREYMRMASERADFENDKELAETRAQYTKEQWPELFGQGFETPGMKDRAVAFMREALSKYAVRLELPGNDQVEGSGEVADLVIGLGLGDVAAQAAIKAQSPTVAQVF
jgi:hypothetical protein